MEINSKATLLQIQTFLNEIETEFVPPLSQRLNINNYAEKLFDNARIFCFLKENRIVSAVLYYVDEIKKTAYIPVLGTVQSHTGNRLMKLLMDKLECTLLSLDYKFLSLETWLGSRALNMYIKRGFYIGSIAKKSHFNRTNITLFKDLRKIFTSYEFIETAIETNQLLSRDLGVNLYIKRDDLFPVIGGGSKARKLKFILKKAIKNGCTAVVTAGSNCSNHLRATAVLCAELGLKLTACIHDEKPAWSEIKGNLKMTLDLSYRHIFLDMKDIKEIMDDEINRYISEGEKPLYIWGGGHSIEGTYSYYNALCTLYGKIEVIPDYIFVASGTGTTQAGILLGVKAKKGDTKVIGVSVARDQSRGRKAIMEAIMDIEPYLPIKTVDLSDIIFEDEFLMGGYGKTTKDLDVFLNTMRGEYGLILDPIYSGKAFYCLWNFVKSGRVKSGSNILFWNTGGVFNLI